MILFHYIYFSLVLQIKVLILNLLIIVKFTLLHYHIHYLILNVLHQLLILNYQDYIFYFLKLIFNQLNFHHFLFFIP